MWADTGAPDGSKHNSDCCALYCFRVIRNRPPCGMPHSPLAGCLKRISCPPDCVQDGIRYNRHKSYSVCAGHDNPCTLGSAHGLCDSMCISGCCAWCYPVQVQYSPPYDSYHTVHPIPLQDIRSPVVYVQDDSSGNRHTSILHCVVHDS